MEVRSATVNDAAAIHSLVNDYAERDRMLYRSVPDIYENIQSFFVATRGGTVVGCCGLDVIWADLAEIKSLAVAENHRNTGVGSALVRAALEKAVNLEVERVFALTLDPAFFEKLGFERIEKSRLPMKVWRDCARCPKQDHCDEVAVITTAARRRQPAAEP